MRRNLYLQHSLMAVQDPRMKRLLRVEKLKGLGAYWFIVEKLMLMPDARAQVTYLKPFCNDPKVPFEYLQKIIDEYGLFIREENGDIMPDELNPVKKTEAKHKDTEAQKGNPEEKKEEKKEEKAGEKRQKNGEKHAKTNENQQKNAENRPKNAENQRKIAQKCAKNEAKNHANAQKNSILPKNNTLSSKENIKDYIIEEEEKEKEIPPSPSSPAAVIQNPEERNLHRLPESWRKLVDDLTHESSWLDLACMVSGYGKLLKRHIQEAANFFKQHVEMYDKGNDLLRMGDVKGYFVNFVRAGTKTSKELHEMLRTLDQQQQATLPPDPYRYEQRVNGKRTYMGCPIPDYAPPRPDENAFWSDISRSWGTLTPSAPPFSTK